MMHQTIKRVIGPGMMFDEIMVMDDERHMMIDACMMVSYG